MARAEQTPGREDMRAWLLVDGALLMHDRGQEGVIPIFTNTYRITNYETPFTRALGLASLPAQFLHKYGRVGDPELYSQLEKMLETSEPITFDMSRFDSHTSVKHGILPSTKYSGLYLMQQQASDLEVGVHAVKNSLAVAQRDLSVPANYNMYLAQLVQGNGHKRE